MDNQLQKMKSYEFEYYDGQLQTEDEFKNFYLSRFKDMVNMIDSQQLCLFEDKYAHSRICKNNTFLLLDRSLNPNFQKILKKMKGTKLDNSNNNQHIKQLDIFCYLDGYHRPNKTLGIRIVKVTCKVYSNQECTRFYPYILVHFYIRKDSTFPKHQKFYCKDKYYHSDEEDIEQEEERELNEKNSFLHKNLSLNKSNQHSNNFMMEEVQAEQHIGDNILNLPNIPIEKMKFARSAINESQNTTSKSETISQLRQKLLDKKRKVSQIQIQIIDAQELLLQLNQ